jgi:dolichyl-phosphate-mannose--protein O-mannosyl transferase
MLVQLLLVSAVVMGLSHTIAKERIFDPLRRKAGGIRTWRGYLVACPYCASHWLAFVLVPLTGTYLIHVVPRWPVASAVLDWFLSSILVTVVAAFLRVGFYLVDEGQRLTRKRIVERAEDRDPPLVQ